MDAFLIDLIVVATAAFCLVALSFGMRLLTYREPKVRRTRAPLPSAALRARPVGR